jgi:hypothetical protein
MYARTKVNTSTHVMADYPKWVDGVLYKSEDEEIELGNQAEKEAMIKELKAAGKDVDGRQYKGPTGFGSLKAYYEAVIKNDNSGNDSK